jgi:hypothetical protein
MMSPGFAAAEDASANMPTTTPIAPTFRMCASRFE